MANSFSHSGVNWMNVWPSEDSGEAGVLNNPIHSPNAGQQFGDADGDAHRDHADQSGDGDAGPPGRGALWWQLAGGGGRALAGGHALGSGCTAIRMGRTGRNVFGVSLRRLGHLSIVRCSSTDVW